MIIKKKLCYGVISLVPDKFLFALDFILGNSFHRLLVHYLHVRVVHVRGGNCFRPTSPWPGLILVPTVGLGAPGDRHVVILHSLLYISHVAVCFLGFVCHDFINCTLT